MAPEDHAAEAALADGVEARNRPVLAVEDAQRLVDRAAAGGSWSAFDFQDQTRIGASRHIVMRPLAEVHFERPSRGRSRSGIPPATTSIWGR